MSPVCKQSKMLEDNEVTYEMQTNLFRRIGKKDWEGALRVLKENPEEAKIWVVTKYRGGTLIDAGEEFTVWYRRLPLHHACNAKSVTPEVLRALLAAYPEALLEKDESGKIPLIHASRRETTLDALKVVLTEETAKEPDSQGKCALHWACEYKANKTKVQLLVETAPSVLKHVDSYDRLPLHWECSVVADRKEKKSVVQYLVEQYPEAVGMKDADGRTPLNMIDLAEVFMLLSEKQAELGGKE